MLVTLKSGLPKSLYPHVMRKEGRLHWVEALADATVFDTQNKSDCVFIDLVKYNWAKDAMVQELPALPKLDSTGSHTDAEPSCKFIDTSEIDEVVDAAFGDGLDSLSPLADHLITEEERDAINMQFQFVAAPTYLEMARDTLIADLKYCLHNQISLLSSIPYEDIKDKDIKFFCDLVSGIRGEISDMVSFFSNILKEEANDKTD